MKISWVLLLIFYFLCAHFSKNNAFWVIEIVDDTMARLQTECVLSLDRIMLIGLCWLLQAVDWLFHVDSQFEQKEPQCIDYTGFDVSSLFDDENGDLDGWVRILL